MECTIYYQSKEAFEALQLYIFSKGISWSSGDTEPLYIGESNNTSGYIQIETGYNLNGPSVVMHLAVADGTQLDWSNDNTKVKAAIERVIMRSQAYKSPEKRVRTVSGEKTSWYDILVTGTGEGISGMSSTITYERMRQLLYESAPIQPSSPPPDTYYWPRTRRRTTWTQ